MALFRADGRLGGAEGIGRGGKGRCISSDDRMKQVNVFSHQTRLQLSGNEQFTVFALSRSQARAQSLDLKILITPERDQQ